jgi:hypothetical protein
VGKRGLECLGTSTGYRYSPLQNDIVKLRYSMSAECNLSVPEFIDPVFTIENERFGLVSAKTGSMNSGT